MTMIIAAGNRDQVILAADRRLSSNERIFTDKYNKVTSITTHDGRIAVGFTGLATYGTHDTQKLILRIISTAVADADGVLQNVPDVLAAKLSQEFKLNPHIRFLGPKARRLTVFMAGYMNGISPPWIVAAAISNFQNFAMNTNSPTANDEFSPWFETEKLESRLERPIILQRFGQYDLMSVNDEVALRNALNKRVAPEIIEEICVGIIRKISDQTTAVGKDISIIRLPSNPSHTLQGGVRYLDAQPLIEGVSSIIHNRHSRDVLTLEGYEISIQNREKKSFTPRQGRNDRCYCGSGIKAKRCHGKV